MHIRTFRAANLNAALGMIREQMGPDASVLHTRQLPRGVLPWLGRRRIEVTAGLKPRRTAAMSDASDASAASAAAEIQTAAAELHTAASGHSHARLGVGSPRSRFCPTAFAPAAHGLTTGPAADLVDELISAGLPTPLATSWVSQAERAVLVSETTALEHGEDASAVQTLRAELNRWLERSIPIGNSIPIQSGHRRVVALVGPTGVGKTTTIAKLAAGFQLRHKVRVGLLTLDTFRAAAIEQLDAFARTLQAPMEVVRRADDVAGALERLGDVDLVFVDTMGQSPRGEVKIAAMARLLAAVQPDETHLVVDANNSFRSAIDILAAFKPLRPTAAIISKMDEVRRPAPVIASLIDGALEISYVTTGQMVPGDIATADGVSLSAAASGLAAVGCEA